jgi:hypothetical protein
MPIKPYGKSGVLLWEATRKALLNNGLSPHGAKKVFIEIVKGDFDFDNEEHFIKRFVLSALEEAERVTDEKKLPKDERKKGWTRELKLSRTPWPKEHKAAAQQGEDIRHVVRNATMRNALLAEYQHWMSQDESGRMASEVFTKLAGSVGLQVETGMHFRLRQKLTALFVALKTACSIAYHWAPPAKSFPGISSVVALRIPVSFWPESPRAFFVGRRS